MRPIPLNIRRHLSLDPRMKKCIACGSSIGIEWHHALIIKGKQCNYPYAIQPLCFRCHRGKNGTIDQYAKIVAELTALTMGLQDLQSKYPKNDWAQRKKWLEILLKRYANENL